MSPPAANATPTPPLAAAVARTVDEQTVRARDAAVLARLKQGPATFDELLGVIHEPWLSEDDRRIALNRSLARLRMKTKQIIHAGGDRWQAVA